MKRLGVSLVGFLSLAGAIAACDGDVRAAVRTLLVLVNTLERDLAFTRAAAST